MGERKFNVRVYGVCLLNGKVLVTDEFIKGKEITKFPGGGLEFGEGTIDGLKREFVEEAGQEVKILRHFYTTDFFVPSAFDPESQVISIYYLVEFLSEPAFPVKEKCFELADRTKDSFAFRWVPLSEIEEDDLTFPIDKRVAGLLRTM